MPHGARWRKGRNRDDEPATKVCRACKRRKVFTAFWQRRESDDGLDPWCRDCRWSYYHRWCAANRQVYNAHHQAYYRQHREKLRAYNREYQRRRRALMRAGKWKARQRRTRSARQPA